MRYTMHPARYDVLDSLESLGDCTAAQLSEDTGRKHTSVQKHLWRSRQEGLVKRHDPKRSPTHGRPPSVWTLTDKGREALERDRMWALGAMV